MPDIISPDYFTLDGVSSATVGLFVDTPIVPPMAQQRYTTWNTGIDSDASSPDDVFEDITVSFSAYLFFRNSNFNLSEIYAFLAGKKVLEFSRFNGRFFRIKQLASVDPSRDYDGNKISFVISFVCDPFKYHSENPETVVSGSTIENPGTRFSRPIYKITHSGGCSLTVNGEVLSIAAGAASPIYIDSQRMFAYNGNGENQTKYTTGNFPFLQPGVNNIATTASALTVTGNWRDY